MTTVSGKRQLRLVKGLSASRSELRPLVEEFLNFHRDLAGDSHATARELDATLRAWLRKGNSTLFLVRGGNHAIGFVVIRKAPDDPVFWLDDLFVKEDLRRSGIGRRIVRAVELFVKGKGGDALYIPVAATNRAALLFYSKLGYSRINMVELIRPLRTTRSNSRSGTRSPVCHTQIAGVDFVVRSLP
jgi:GNAT superfamily N-acetyltransferase